MLAAGKVHHMKDAASQGSSLLERTADAVGLNRWFVRRRPFAADLPRDILVSPCDAVVQKVSQVGSDGAIEEKSLFGRQRHIHLDEILALANLRAEFHDGWYIKQYLSLLRLHYLVFPCGGTVASVSRTPGKAWPILLFRSADVRNGRMTFLLETAFGFPIVVVMIGSWNVTGIRASAGKGDRVRRGDLLGEFRIGSSVVTLFPPETVEILVGEGDETPIGRPLARVLPVPAMASVGS